MPISSRFVVRSTFAFLIVGFVALLCIVGMTFWLGQRAQVYFDQTIAARDTRGAAVDLRNSLQTAESSQRGFMLTSNEIYLAPYDTAKSQAQRQLALLTAQLAPFPDTAVSVQRLTEIVKEKFDELDATIALKRARKDEDALAILRTNKGKALIDEANVFFSGIIRQADDRLTAGVDEQRNNASWLRIASAIGTLVIIAVVGGAAWTLYRYTAELRETRDELNSLNADLETRVSERTADLSLARDHAEVLLREVNHRVANSLTLVSSLISLQSKAVDDAAAKKALSETQDRIFAISLVHRRLYGSNDVRMVMLNEYLAGLLDHLQTSMKSEEQGAVLSYELEPVLLETDASVNLGVILTEWVTNAFKYAYPQGNGEIRVKLKHFADNQIELLVEDDGVGRSEDEPAKGTGLGTRIVTAMAASLSAKVAYQARGPGLSAQLLFPATLKAAAQ